LEYKEHREFDEITEGSYWVFNDYDPHEDPDTYYRATGIVPWYKIIELYDYDYLKRPFYTVVSDGQNPMVNGNQLLNFYHKCTDADLKSILIMRNIE
jgi:hypothetical protein